MSATCTQPRSDVREVPQQLRPAGLSAQAFRWQGSAAASAGWLPAWHVTCKADRMPTSRSNFKSLVAACVLVGCVPQGKYDAALADATRARASFDASQRTAQASRQESQTELADVRRELAETQASLQSAQQDLEFVGGIALSCGEALDESSAANQGLMESLDKRGKDVAQLVAAQSELTGSLERARAGLEELRGARAAAEAREAMFRDVAQRLGRILDSGELKISLRSGRMVLVLPSDVLFEAGKATVGRNGRKALAEVGSVLGSLAGRRFQVSGHTDADPIRVSGFASNWELSSARALEVVSLLIQAGMQPSALSSAGYAEFDPVVANDSPVNKAKNRRIEIALQPNIDQLVDVPRVAAAVTGSP
jgi:chemotaxis protein MotB